jgi:hypothetical protein
LTDGYLLVALGEVLTGHKFDKKLTEKPENRLLKIENVSLALNFLRPYLSLPIEVRAVAFLSPFLLSLFLFSSPLLQFCRY